MRATPTRSWRAVPAPSPADGIVGDSDPTPPAAVTLLQAADGAPVAVGFGLHAVCAHGVEANTAGIETRRVSVIVPPACRRSRLWVTRSGSVDPLAPAPQADHEHASGTGGGYAGAAVSVASSLVAGAEVYLQTDAALPMTSLQVAGTGTQVNDAPGAPIDRALAVPEVLGPSLELYQVKNVAGFSVQFFERTADLESL